MSLIVIKIRGADDTVTAVLHKECGFCEESQVESELVAFAEAAENDGHSAKINVLIRYTSWPMRSEKEFRKMELKVDDIIFDVYEDKIFKGGIDGVSYVL